MQAQVNYPITQVSLPSFTLVGTQTKIISKDEENPETARIGDFIHSYYVDQQFNKINHRTAPFKTYIAYSEIQGTCQTNDLTFQTLVGEQVDQIEGQPEEFKVVVVPAQKYSKFTVGPGKIPEMIINFWKQLYELTPEQIGGKRTSLVDFELYDEKSKDLNNAVVEIYIGIE